MATSASSIDHNLNAKQNQFQEIHTVVQKYLDEKRKVLLVLDIDGVQDDARLEIEKVIKEYLETSEDFVRHISETVIPSVISLCSESAISFFLKTDNPFKSLIDYIRLTEMCKKDREDVFSSLEQSRTAKDHKHYLSYCELLKTLRKTEPSASDDAVRDEITKNITSNTALICAMHLSTAICATSPLAVADKSDEATASLVALYRDFQRGDKKDSAIIQLTARTEAMAYTFDTSLRTMLAENNTQLKSLEEQDLQYNYNKEKFPLHPTRAIDGSNIIAASRNEKDLVVREFLEQNSLLSDNVQIVFVDDSNSAHKDMKRLPTRPEVTCTLEPVLFERNRSDKEKHALCAQVAESLKSIGLETAIAQYEDTSKKLGDSATSAVMSHYVPDLLNQGIIDQEEIVQALTSNSPPQQSSPTSRTWSNANPSAHFSSPEKKIKIEESQQLTVTNTPQP